MRLVRLTRPEVILTWLPDYVAGENHGDHQASGVIATEAFSLAGDPTQFPEQVSAPRDRQNISNLTEGLRVWQPKKLYYFSDASHTDFLTGKGPEYSITEVSASRHVPYFRLVAEEMSFHLTQGDTGQEAKKALATGKLDAFKQPEHLVLGKSLVKSSVTGDLFEGIGPGPVPFAPLSGYQPKSHNDLWMELGGPWAFYRRFWKAQGIATLAELLPIPEVSLGAGETLHVPLLIHNDTAESTEVRLAISTPSGWPVRSGAAGYPVRAHDVYPAETSVTVPAGTAHGWQEVRYRANSGGRTIGSITLRVNIASGGLPQ